MLIIGVTLVSWLLLIMSQYLMQVSNVLHVSRGSCSMLIHVREMGSTFSFYTGRQTSVSGAK